MVLIYDLSTSKLNNESDVEFIQRMCSNKEALDLTWKELTEILNNELGYSYSESYYRKHFILGDFVSIQSHTTSASSTNDYADTESLVDVYDNINDKLLEMKKERVKLNDERAENRRYVTRLSREETIKEIAADYANKMSKKKLPLLSVAKDNSTVKSNLAEGVLLLSDWHYGMVCDNSWNKFDPQICEKRVRKLLDKVINIVHKENLPRVTVLNLSDLIAGRIHTQIRIESRIDVMTQIMNVSEILAEFLSELSSHCDVQYYDCLDNHSRLEQNKAESWDLESLARIIPWYLKERLVNIPNIQIGENEFGPDIITCKVMGHEIIGVHGNDDRPTNALERLSLMTHHHYDMLCTAHLHHFSADEQHQSVVVSNSSLMGVDSHSKKLRLTSDPSQTMVIVTKENACDIIYRILLK